MPNEEKMTINERRKYLRLIKKRYLQASKLERGRLLDEVVLLRPQPTQKRPIAHGHRPSRDPPNGRVQTLLINTQLLCQVELGGVRVISVYVTYSVR